jgi:hypothetical protein
LKPPAEFLFLVLVLLLVVVVLSASLFVTHMVLLKNRGRRK